MNLTAERIALLAERLHLLDLPAELPVLAEQAVAASWSCAEFAERLLARLAEAADCRAEAPWESPQACTSARASPSSRKTTWGQIETGGDGSVRDRR